MNFEKQSILDMFVIYSHEIQQNLKQMVIVTWNHGKN
jgi:hypothetical protein